MYLNVFWLTLKCIMCAVEKYRKGYVLLCKKAIEFFNEICLWKSSILEIEWKIHKYLGQSLIKDVENASLSLNERSVFGLLTNLGLKGIEEN